MLLRLTATFTKRGENYEEKGEKNMMEDKNRSMVIGLCFMIVSALIFSAAAVPAFPVEDDEVNIPQTATIGPELDLEMPLTEMEAEMRDEPSLRELYDRPIFDREPHRNFMYDDFDMLLHPQDSLNAEEEESDGPERTFIGVTSIRADSPVIYLNQDNMIYFTVNNLGGDVGDAAYTENITAAIESIEELRDQYSGHPRVGQLEKAIERLEEALLLVSEHQREESIKSVRQAVTHLNAAGQGRQGILTEQIIIELAEIVQFKVTTVINEATSNFGSEHPDVQEAEDIYEDAVDKLDNGKYIPAMNRFRKAFETVLGAYICDVNLELYSWMRDGYESEIGNGFIESFEAESYEVITLTWSPTRRGIHYVRTNITGEYMVYSSDGEKVESPTKLFSTGFVVTSEDEPEKWGPGYNYTSVITVEEGIRYRDGPLVIEVYDDLEIQSGAALQLNESITLVMMNTEPGEFSILIEPDGTFIIESPVESATITSSDEGYRNTYPFINHGNVHFTGAAVMDTHGPDDLSLPAGIQNLPGSTCILDNTNILEADTHSVYASEDSSVQIMGADTVIGRDLDGQEDNDEIAKGHGIFIEGAVPNIRDVTVKYNRQDGIRVVDSKPGPIQAASLHEYDSGDYDRQLTHDDNTSTLPVIVAGNGNLYMVYLDEDAQHINFMRSSDQGSTWSAPAVVPGSEVEEGFIRNIDIDADGDNLAVAWDVWIPWDGVIPYGLTGEDEGQRYIVKLNVQHSSDGGASWADVPYVIDDSSFPSVAVEGDTVYVAYYKGPYYRDLYMPYPVTVRIRWAADGWEEVEEHVFDIMVGVPKVAVTGETVHVAIAGFEEIIYVRSDDGGVDSSEMFINGLSYMAVTRGRTW